MTPPLLRSAAVISNFHFPNYCSDAIHQPYPPNVNGVPGIVTRAVRLLNQLEGLLNFGNNVHALFFI